MDFSELYYVDPDCLTFDATVIESTPLQKPMNGYRYAVVLDQTAFYPEGGGQPADYGTLNEVNVLDVQMQDGRIVHFVDTPLSEGSVVRGSVNSERRRDHSQQHSGEHIVSGLVHQRFGYNNVGFGISEDDMTLDFDGVLEKNDLAEIERLANVVVQQNLPIEILFPDKTELDQLDYRSKIEIEGAVRLVRIPGVDLCACCGTQVRRTGEIGPIKIKQFMAYKRGTRLSVVCGMRAVRLFQMLADQAQTIKVLLSEKDDALVEGVKQVLAALETSHHREYMLARKLMQERLDAFPDEQDIPLVYDGKDLTAAETKDYAKQLSRKTRSFAFVIGERTERCRLLLLAANYTI